MANIAPCLNIDEEQAVRVLQKAREQLTGSDGEVVLDFAGVRRIDSKALTMMEELAALADKEGIQVGLRGVNVGVYKVLKLMKLAPRFSFLA